MGRVVNSLYEVVVVVVMLGGPVMRVEQPRMLGVWLGVIRRGTMPQVAGRVVEGSGWWWPLLDADSRRTHRNSNSNSNSNSNGRMRL